MVSQLSYGKSTRSEHRSITRRYRTIVKQLGFTIQREAMYEHDSVVIGTLKGTDAQAPKLILNGHIDVASVEDDQYWTYPPFQLTEHQDWLYGRGVSDMKGGMSSLFYVLERLHQEGHRPKGDIIVSGW